MTRLTFRRGDAVVIAAILAAALALTAAFVLSARRGAAASVEIRQNGEVLAVLPLDEDAEFTVGGAYTNVIEVRGGEVFFAESDCPGQDCVHSGAVSAAGRSLVCLPNRVEVRITADVPDENAVDGVAG